jgi:hypothetical protein
LPAIAKLAKYKRFIEPIFLPNVGFLFLRDLGGYGDLFWAWSLRARTLLFGTARDGHYNSKSIEEVACRGHAAGPNCRSTIRSKASKTTTTANSVRASFGHTNGISH